MVRSAGRNIHGSVRRSDDASIVANQSAECRSGCLSHSFLLGVTDSSLEVGTLLELGRLLRCLCLLLLRFAVIIIVYCIDGIV